MSDAAPLDTRLARERTSLSWTRTALALLLNAVLVLVRHDDAFPLAVSAALATLACAVAAIVLVDAARRSGLVHQPEHEIVAATFLVVPLGVAVALLGLGTTVALVLY